MTNTTKREERDTYTFLHSQCAIPIHRRIGTSILLSLVAVFCGIVVSLTHFGIKSRELKVQEAQLAVLQIALCHLLARFDTSIAPR